MPVVTEFSDLKQLKRLYACIESIKSWFEMFLAIPPADYIGFPFSISSQLVHCLTTLYRLSTLNDSNWDKGSVRETTDLLPILDQVINNMEQVAAVAGLDDSDIAEGYEFFRTARKFRPIRLEWLPTPQSDTDGSCFGTLPGQRLDDGFPSQSELLIVRQIRLGASQL